MQFHAYNDCTWLYPDMEISGQTQNYTSVSARGGSFGVQILTDLTLDKEIPVTYTFDTPAQITCQPHQLIASRVEANSGKNFMTAETYEEVAHFVTRKAPFDVLEAAKPIDDGSLRSGRLAFYLLFEVNASVEAGSYLCIFTLSAGDASFVFPITIQVTPCVIPSLKDARFGMVNWLFLPDIAKFHHVELYSEPFWAIVEKYLDNQIGLRTNHIQIPAGEPIRDAEGKVVDFDFTVCEKMGELALKHGFSYIYGGFVARFQNWQHEEQFLLWDKQIGVSSIEGYRQLSIYFKKLWDVVVRHNWMSVWMQCLVDEPQFYNSMSYRALSGICRRFMPGVIIHDPVETTDIAGAVDIWCVKQAVYEKYIEDFRRLQDCGEEMWVYTCGFPAGYWMNRSTDLPLLAGRLPMWMCIKYGMTGFLHWGYNAYGDRDPFQFNCFGRDNGKALPPGDGFIVYPGDDGRPWNSVRSFLQRFAAEDYEALCQLPRDVQMGFVDRLCRTFEDYENDPAVFEAVRTEMLESFQ